MIVLTLRSDKPEAELGLYDDEKKLVYETWPAHRELAETIHKKIEELLNESSKSLKDIDGIVCFKGPGSFTGLRISLTVTNALAYSLKIPVVATSGENWIEQGTKKLRSGHNDKIALPEYGSDPHVTQQRK